MTRSRPDEIEFLPDDPAVVVSRMGTMTASRSGWINVRPVIDKDDEPPPPGLFAIFGGSIHKVPTGTWMPGKIERSGSPKPTIVGLQHSGGRRVTLTLRDRGLPLPAGWRVTQDHPRRGLVAHVPVDAVNEEVLDWLLRAGITLCEVPMTGRWRAAVHGTS